MVGTALSESGNSEFIDLPRLRSPERPQLLWSLDAFNKFLLSAAPLPRFTSGLGKEVCTTLGLSRMVYLHIDFNTRRAKAASGYGLDARCLTRIDEPFEAGPWIEACLTSGRPSHTSNAKRGPAVPMRYVTMFGIGPLLCVPVSDSRGPFGAMLLDRHGSDFSVSDELIEAARAVGLSIGLALESAAAARSHPGNGSDWELHLTPRERQMLRLLSRGLSNKQIAAATGLSVFTVRDYVSSLLRCLDVTSRSAAVARSWELGLWNGGSDPC